MKGEKRFAEEDAKRQKLASGIPRPRHVQYAGAARQSGPDLRRRSRSGLSEEEAGMRLRILLGDHPHTAALKSGAITSDLVELDFAGLQAHQQGLQAHGARRRFRRR